MILGFCLASFGILFCSVVFGCRYLKLLDCVVSGACFFSGACLTVIFPIVDLWQCCVCCTRSGVTDAPTLFRTTCAFCASPGYTRCFDRTSVYLCASPLQNLAISLHFYSPLSISLERSGWPRIRWCGLSGFREQVQCLFVGLVALSFVFNYFPFLFFSSIGW